MQNEDDHYALMTSLDRFDQEFQVRNGIVKKALTTQKDTNKTFADQRHQEQNMYKINEIMADTNAFEEELRRTNQEAISSAKKNNQS